MRSALPALVMVLAMVSTAGATYPGRDGRIAAYAPPERSGGAERTFVIGADRVAREVIWRPKGERAWSSRGSVAIAHARGVYVVERAGSTCRAVREPTSSTPVGEPASRSGTPIRPPVCMSPRTGARTTALPASTTTSRRSCRRSTAAATPISSTPRGAPCRSRATRATTARSRRRRGGGIVGGPGGDVLHGGNAADDPFGDLGDHVLLGRAGADRLRGDRGHDVLVGGPGRDTFGIARDGRDTVRARDGARDRVICGWLPHSLSADRVDRLDRCAFPVAISANTQLTPRRRLRLRLRCPWLAPGGCRGTVVLLDGRPDPLGRARFALPAGRVRRLALRLARMPVDLAIVAVVVDRRARPPARERTTVWPFHLSPP